MVFTFFFVVSILLHDFPGVNGLISFHILGRRMVVLNSAADAANLLTKRSTIYSDRPFPTMAGLLMRREKSIFYMYESSSCEFELMGTDGRIDPTMSGLRCIAN
jgi:hypothetical protein